MFQPSMMSSKRQFAREIFDERPKCISLIKTDPVVTLKGWQLTLGLIAPVLCRQLSYAIIFKTATTVRLFSSSRFDVRAALTC
jgi:hypothetical protein